MTSIEIRPARSTDAEAIVAVIRESFDPSVLNMTIYGCAGIARFIRRQIETPATLADTHYQVALDNDRVVGCIELRQSQRMIFLNYIAVLLPYRSQGIAARLLQRSLGIFSLEAFETMWLDVLINNKTARQWYTRLGFEEEYRTGWYELQIEDTGTSEGVYISGYPQAEICQREFGFSQFQIASVEGEHTIGQIGGNWFRTTTTALIRDRAVLVALRQLDEKRRLLAVLRAEEAVCLVPHKNPMLTMSRLYAPLGKLWKKVESGSK